MNNEFVLLLNEIERKALSDILHHELDCAKCFMADGVYDTPERIKEGESRINVLTYVVDVLDNTV